MANQLEQQLYTIATYLREDIKKRLIDDGHTATGELVDSIRTAVSREISMYVINGYMAKQGVFIISGRSAGAKGVPIDALMKWIENKGFSDGIKYTKGIAFAIQKSIKKKGIKPNDFIGKSFDENRLFIGNRLMDAVSEQMHLSITNMINNAKGFA